MPPRRTSGAFGARELLRIAFVVVGWIGFVWMWVLVGRQPWDSSRLVWLIVGAFVIVPLLTLAWVLHNRALFKRKGERRGVTPADFAYATDWHGRTVDADWSALARSRFVTVSVEGERKVYRIDDAELVHSVGAPLGAGAFAAPPSNDRAAAPAG